MNRFDWLKDTALPKMPSTGESSNWLSASIVLPSAATGLSPVRPSVCAGCLPGIEQPIDVQDPGRAAQDEEHQEEPRPGPKPTVQRVAETDADDQGRDDLDPRAQSDAPGA